MLRSCARARSTWLMATLALLCASCTPAASESAGGTAGKLRVGSKTALPDVQVNVYAAESEPPQLIGFGISRLDGQFELFKKDGTGPLWLEPGKYAFTLESIGAVPLTWKVPVSSANKTPLRKTWTASDTMLELDVPEPTAKK